MDYSYQTDSTSHRYELLFGDDKIDKLWAMLEGNNKSKFADINFRCFVF